MPWAEHDHESPLPPPSPSFHPEMGYFSPSLPTRRLMRVGLITGVCGIVLGAIAAMALVPGQRLEAARVGVAATVGEAAARIGTDTAGAVAPGASAAARKPCSEQASPSSDRNCGGDTSGKAPGVRVLAPSPVSPGEGARAALQGAVPAAGDLTPTDEPQPPAATPPAHEKTAHVRKKKRSRSRQDDPRSAYAAPNGGRYEPGARYDYGTRYDSGTRYDYGSRRDYGPRYPQQRQSGNRGGWSW
jgi:hypothetical protein